MAALAQTSDFGVEPAVRLEGVLKRFGHQEALAGIDGVILPGRLTGLVGPDGAGKTTLIRLMAGLLVPTRGNITVMGLNTVHDSTALSHIVGYMPQRFGLYEDLSVIENLRLYAQLNSSITASIRRRPPCSVRSSMKS